MYDAIIIGGGVTGCAVARVLSRYQGSFLLLEAGADVAHGASKANSGIVHAGFDAEPGSQKAYYNVLGAGMYEALAREFGVPYRRNEAMVLSFSEEDGATLKKLMDQGEKNGVAGMTWLTGEEARKLEPAVNPGVVAALRVASSAVVSPYEMTIALAYHAAQNGVCFERNRRVSDIAFRNGIFNVTASGQSYQARCVIVCAGVHAGEIRSMLSGVPLNIIPRRGEYYLLDPTLPAPFTRTMFQCPGKMGKGVLVTPTAHGNVLLGPSADDIKDMDDTATTARGLAFVLEKCRLTWPQVSTRQVITTFSGVRAHASDGDFSVGAVPGAPEGAFEAAGIESPGLSAAPAIGEKLGEMAAEYLKLDFKEAILPPVPLLRPFAGMSDAERAAACKQDPAYGTLICRCEQVTEAEIVDAIRRPVGARTIDGVKHRTRSGMGRCQGGFCSPRILEILCRETGMQPLQVCKNDAGSELLTGTL